MFLLGSWWVINLRVAIYFVGYFLITAISCDIMLKVNQETLAARGKVNTDSPKWDKVILAVYWLLAYFVIYFVAGLEIKKQPKLGNVFIIGIALQIFSSVLALRALMVNTFLESTARVQYDRHQVVCCIGPYSVVRHPTYLSIIIWCIGIDMIFETRLVIIISIIIALIIIMRTYLEDRMLKEKLKGYKEYAKEVKYRLVPYLW